MVKGQDIWQRELNLSSSRWAIKPLDYSLGICSSLTISSLFPTLLLSTQLPDLFSSCHTQQTHNKPLSTPACVSGTGRRSSTVRASGPSSWSARRVPADSALASWDHSSILS